MYARALYVILIGCVMIAFILADSRMQKEAKKKKKIEWDKTQQNKDEDKKDKEENEKK